MKKLSFFLATFILNVNSYGAGCSYGLLDSFNYRAIYYQQLVHSQTFPKLKSLHEYVKSGAITGAQLEGWQGNALALCYMNYPLTKVPVNIVPDYLK